MILDISDDKFRWIFKNEKFFLPARWDGQDFSQTLIDLYSDYLAEVRKECCFYERKKCKCIRFFSCPLADCNFNCKWLQEDSACQLTEIGQVCNSIVEVVEHYLNGFPAQSYYSFEKMMPILQKIPLKLYQKSNFGAEFADDKLRLYRAVKVNDNARYKRDRVFHVPYNLRSKVSASRYSIAGYPSLYLATALDLCCKEINSLGSSTKTIAARFQLDRDYERNNVDIQVIELALKPQDFLQEGQNNERPQQHWRRIEENLLRSSSIRAAYLLWYPLIAACSFIRPSKNDPFAAEYIIPQLLMQWVRNELSVNSDNGSKMMGIRYFSCASVETSDMGFNYVFPTSGRKHADYPFCSTLLKSFFLTEPVYTCDYPALRACERALNEKNALQKITGEQY